MNGDQLAALSKPERLELWVEIVNWAGIAAMLELGVYSGRLWAADLASSLAHSAPAARSLSRAPV